jgi:uncharacterized protein YjbJ (UPF0337 family)
MNRAGEPSSEVDMNWTQMEGKWEQLKGDVKTQWAKLTEDDLAYVSGQRDKLVGKLQERYGMIREKAQEDVDAWFERVGARIDRIGQPRHP